MPTAPPLSRDATLDTQVFWLKHKTEIVAAIAVALLALAGFGAYRIYASQRSGTAAELLAGASSDRDYEAIIARYPGTAAAASAYMLLAQSEQKEKKLPEANATLQKFVDKYPNHELVPTAKTAMAANLESLGKMDEALALYQQIAASYPKSFNAPMALLSQVSILKAKNQAQEARQICERIMTDYRDSLWMTEAARQLRLLKPPGEPEQPPKTPNLSLGPAGSIQIPQPNAMPSAPPQPIPSASKPH